MGRRRTEARKQKLVERWVAASSGAGPSAPIAGAQAIPGDPVEALITRSRKVRARGDTRRALVLLRQACALDEWRARTWTLLGVTLADAGDAREAHRALTQARWLRARAGEKARAAVTARLADRLLDAA